WTARSCSIAVKASAAKVGAARRRRAGESAAVPSGATARRSIVRSTSAGGPSSTSVSGRWSAWTTFGGGDRPLRASGPGYEAGLLAGAEAGGGRGGVHPEPSEADRATGGERGRGRQAGGGGERAGA